MRSAQYHGKRDIRLEDIPEPQQSPGTILVEVEWCGLCGSDLHLYELGPDAFGELTKHGQELPYALGHEFCGRVKSPPPGSRFQDGDPVMIDPRLPCGQCTVCKSGKAYGCPKQGGIGYNHGGGLAERAAVPAANLHLLPGMIPLEYAPLIEPFAVAVHGIRQVGITTWTNQVVLVVGGGPVGFALIIALAAYSPRSIIVSEPTSARRKQVREFVELALDPAKGGIAGRCKELTPGGVDVVFDCAGTAAGLSDGLDALKCEGIYMNLAMHAEPMSLPVLPLLLKHVTLKFSAVYSAADMGEAIRLFAEGQYRGYEKMVTKRIGIDDVVEKGFQELIEHKDDHIKIMVTPKRHNLTLREVAQKTEG